MKAVPVNEEQGGLGVLGHNSADDIDWDSYDNWWYTEKEREQMRIAFWANVVAKAMTSINGNGNGGSTESITFEGIVKGLILGGDYQLAIDLIICHFRDFDFVDRSYYYFVFSDPSRYGFSTTNESLTAEESNSGKEDILFRIDVGIGTLLAYANGRISFGQLVRNLWHEINHVAQQTGTKPYSSKMEGVEFHNEREFLAAYRSITNTTLPNLWSKEKEGMILATITNQVTIFDYQTRQWKPFGDFYHKLSSEKQAQYSSYYDELKQIYYKITGKKLN